MDDVLYFQKKFLQTLNVPVSRLNSDALFSIGRATEITRDELKFARFVSRLRLRFTHLFTKMLEKQLVLKGVMTFEDFQQISMDIRYEFAKDNYFSELKNNEITDGRTQLARSLQDMAGKYYSHAWIRKNILKQSDDDVEKMDAEIENENESQDPRWLNPTIEQNMQMQDQQQQAAQGGEGGQPSPEDENKYEQVRQAMVFVDQMKKMPKGQRSIQDQSKYKAAVQVIAKNPDVAKQMGSAAQQ
jgi:hypothetical protein